MNLYAPDPSCSTQYLFDSDLELRFSLEGGQIFTPCKHLVIRHGRFPFYIFRHLSPEGEAEPIEVAPSSSSVWDGAIPKLARGDLFIFPAQTVFVPQSAPFGALCIIIDGKRYEPWRVPSDKITLARVVALESL